MVPAQAKMVPMQCVEGQPNYTLVRFIYMDKLSFQSLELCSSISPTKALIHGEWDHLLNVSKVRDEKTNETKYFLPPHAFFLSEFFSTIFSSIHQICETMG